jgi:hypothetical protein
MQLAISHMVLIARFDHSFQSSFMFFFTIKVLLPFRSLKVHKHEIILDFFFT